jgi:uncharacterized MnhB-related membrane protein
MIPRMILLALLPVVAGIALLQRRRLSAIIGMGLFSFLLAAVYLLMHAPDVAITEATIGAALVTAIYVLAIRRTGKLIVVADEVPGLIAREGHGIAGLEYEILAGFAASQGLDLSVEFVPLRRVRWLIAHQEADIGAGGFVPRSDEDGDYAASPPHLETGVFTLTGREPHDGNALIPDYEGYFSELAVRAKHSSWALAATSLDLARALVLTRHGAPLDGLHRQEGAYAYAFLLPRGRAGLLSDYSVYLEHLRETGELDAMIRRHFP